MERAVYQTRAETLHKEYGTAAHRPPEGIAGHRAGGKKLTQGDSFVYLGSGSVWRREDGEREVSRRVRVESSWWGDGGPADLKKTKEQRHEHLCDTGMPVRNGNVDNDRTTTAKAARVRKQLGTKISRVQRTDGRRRVALREDTGMQRSLTEILVRSRLLWAGHVERMADNRLPKRAAELREDGRSRRGRPRLRWEDRVKRDVRKAGEEEDWKKKRRDRGGWKRLSDEAVKKLRAAPHP